MTYTYKVRKGKYLEVRMVPQNPAAVIYYRYPGGEWDVTPFQTANAKHDLSTAYHIVQEWDLRQG